MIGKTTLKCRSSAINIGKEDLCLWSLVWIIIAVSIVFPLSKTWAQTNTGSKSKDVKASATSSPSTNSAKDDAEESIADDNGDDETEDNESDPVTADDNEETPSNQVVEDDIQEIIEPAEPQTEAEPEVAQEEPIPPPPDEVVNETPTKSPPVETVQPTVEPLPIEPVEKVADAEMVEVIPGEKTVEIEPFKQYTNYRDRRTRHGFLFNLNAENLYFQDYASIIDQTLYEDMFGQEDLTLLQANIGYKLNFFLGSLTIGGGYGQGTLVDNLFLDAQGVNQERTLTIGKTTGHIQWMLDSLMKEPYFVPYAGVSMWQMDLTEIQKVGGESFSYTTGYGTSLTVGFLVQLNWLEPETSKLAYLSQGLENTYLDVFWTQYQNTDEELDPIFENDFNFGVGLRLEF